MQRAPVARGLLAALFSNALRPQPITASKTASARPETTVTRRSSMFRRRSVSAPGDDTVETRHQFLVRAKRAVGPILVLSATWRCAQITLVTYGCRDEKWYRVGGPFVMDVPSPSGVSTAAAQICSTTASSSAGLAEILI